MLENELCTRLSGLCQGVLGVGMSSPSFVAEVDGCEGGKSNETDDQGVKGAR